MDVPWIRAHREGCLVAVWVVPGARREGVSGVHGDALKVWVAVPPEQGKATRAVARLLQAATGARAVRLERGRTARKKQFVLVGITPDEARRSLGS